MKNFLILSLIALMSESAHGCEKKPVSFQINQIDTIIKYAKPIAFKINTYSPYVLPLMPISGILTYVTLSDMPQQTQLSFFKNIIVLNSIIPLGLCLIYQIKQ